jgi:hypothetical protein
VPLLCFALDNFLTFVLLLIFLRLALVFLCLELYTCSCWAISSTINNAAPFDRKISPRQYKQMARLLKSYQSDDQCQNDSETSPQGTNNRPLQTLNGNGGQGIYHCTPDSFGYFVYPPELQ